MPDSSTAFCGAPAVNSSRPVLLESLESRRMLSTVNVASFGARPNDGLDDTSAIRAAIGASEPGDTVYFGSGTFIVRDVIDYTGNRTYKGIEGESILSRTDTWRQGQTAWNDAKNITFDGLTFEGNGLLLQGKGGATNITVQNCVFRNMTHHANDQKNMIIINLLMNSKIINNRFENIFGDNGILGYNLLGNVRIEGNLFKDVNEGIHLMNFNAYATGISVSFNEFIGIHRMGVEIQESPDHLVGGFDGLLVQGNYLHDFGNGNNESFALSIVADKGTNTLIKDNVINGKSPKTGNPYIWYGIEAAGINTVVENNQICTSFVGISIETGANGIVRGNKINGIVNSTYWVARHPGVRFIDNQVGGSGECTAPSMGPVEGGGSSPGSQPNPIPGSGSPIGIAPMATAKVVDSSRINVTWRDPSTAEDGFSIERSYDGVSFIEAGTVGANKTLFQDKSLPSGTLVYYRVRWFMGSTFGPYSNIVVAQTSGIPRTGGPTSGGGTGGVGTTPGGGVSPPVFGNPASFSVLDNDSVFSDSLLA